MKQFRLNYAHKIFNNAYPSYLKNNFIKIYEHDNHKHNTTSSHFNCVTLKIKGIDSTFYHSVIKDWKFRHDSTKFVTDLHIFNKKVKCHLKCTSEELERCVISYK